MDSTVGQFPDLPPEVDRAEEIDRICMEVSALLRRVPEVSNTTQQAYFVRCTSELVKAEDLYNSMPDGEDHEVLLGGILALRGNILKASGKLGHKKKSFHIRDKSFRKAEHIYTAAYNLRRTPDSIRRLAEIKIIRAVYAIDPRDAVSLLKESEALIGEAIALENTTHRVYCVAGEFCLATASLFPDRKADMIEKARLAFEQAVVLAPTGAPGRIARLCKDYLGKPRLPQRPIEAPDIQSSTRDVA